MLILHDSTAPAGIAVSLLLLLGYALDSADGQLARVRGGGSKAGEWLDHVADIAKISSLHSAVAIAVLRYFDLDSLLYLAVPVIFLVANVTQFFGMMLRDKLTAASRAPPAPAGSSLAAGRVRVAAAGSRQPGPGVPGARRAHPVPVVLRVPGAVHRAVLAAAR